MRSHLPLRSAQCGEGAKDDELPGFDIQARAGIIITEAGLGQHTGNYVAKASRQIFHILLHPVTIQRVLKRFPFFKPLPLPDCSTTFQRQRYAPAPENTVNSVQCIQYFGITNEGCELVYDLPDLNRPYTHV